MAKILVTGGAGFIGSHFVNSLLSDGHEVMVVDSFAQYISPPVNATYLYNVNYRFNSLIKGSRIIRGNTLDKDNLRRILIETAPEYIVHFAALPLANMAIQYTEEAFNTIVGGTVNILEVLRDVQFLKKFVYISSSMVYGDFVQVPLPEDAPKDPKEIYGGMKLAGEYMVKVYSKRYGIPFSIIRPSAVYGPTDNNRRVIGIFLSSALKGEPIRAQNAEDTVLDFSYVGDVAAGIKAVTLSEKADGQAFNITRGRGRLLQEAIDIILKLYPKTPVEYVNKDSFRPKRGSLDVARARALVGFNPSVDIEEGIPKYAEFLEEAERACKDYPF